MYGAGEQRLSHEMATPLRHDSATSPQPVAPIPPTTCIGRDKAEGTRCDGARIVLLPRIEFRVGGEKHASARVRAQLQVWALARGRSGESV